MPLLLGENAVMREQVEETLAALAEAGRRGSAAGTTVHQRDVVQAPIGWILPEVAIRTGTGGADDLIGILRVTLLRRVGQGQ